MMNGAGEARVVENTYDLVGNLTQKKLPSGELFRFFYSSKGTLEKTSYPDGTYSLQATDNNGRVVRSIDRRLLEVAGKYNRADMLVQTFSSDATYGDIVRSIKGCHFGAASIVETEGGVEKSSSSLEYHWSGSPSKVIQTVDSHSLQMQYGYDNAGNQVWMTPTGSGASPWTQKFNLKPQYHPSIPDTDAFNRTAIEKDGSTHVITQSGS